MIEKNKERFNKYELNKVGNNKDAAYADRLYFENLLRSENSYNKFNKKFYKDGKEIEDDREE